MESIGKISQKYTVAKPKNKYLHSANHLLADELCQTLRDPKHFGFYLKQASRFPHDMLRKLAAEIVEKPGVETPGKLFAYLIKQQNDPAHQQTAG
jgi:hypothetical protein